VKRRTFIAGLGSAAAWPVAARAQQPAVPVVGFINGGTPEGYAPMVAAFRQGLNESGYVEGQNVAVEYLWADGRYDRVPAMALPELTARAGNGSGRSSHRRCEAPAQRLVARKAGIRR
jgi:hypothetical protein